MWRIKRRSLIIPPGINEWREVLLWFIIHYQTSPDSYWSTGLLWTFLQEHIPIEHSQISQSGIIQHSSLSVKPETIPILTYWLSLNKKKTVEFENPTLLYDLWTCYSPDYSGKCLRSIMSVMLSIKSNIQENCCFLYWRWSWSCLPASVCWLRRWRWRWSCPGQPWGRWRHRTPRAAPRTQPTDKHHNRHHHHRANYEENYWRPVTITSWWQSSFLNILTLSFKLYKGSKFVSFPSYVKFSRFSTSILIFWPLVTWLGFQSQHFQYLVLLSEE